MKNSLKSRLLTFLQRQGGEVSSGYLQKRADEFGYTGSYASRQLRLLAEEGKIQVMYKGRTKHAYYSAGKPKKTEVYLVNGKEVLKVKRY